MLNPNLTSRYSRNASAIDIINELRIEQWNEQINYESYYQNCHPNECIYIITKHLHIATVITTVISLFGGLSVILKILTPLFIKFIRWLRKVKDRNTETTVYGQLEPWYRRLIRRISQMNAFRNIETDAHPHIRRNQIISTRLYISFWLISIVILSVYNGFAQEKSYFEINLPSITLINELQSKNVDEFTCPCLETVISFQKFTSLNYTFHQVINFSIHFPYTVNIFNILDLFK